jgi:phage terminase small subunit
LKAQEKRSLFVREYLVDRNGTRAAIAAGYAPRSASVTSCRLLRNAKVKAEVSELTEERLEHLEITADTVLQELAKIAFANMKDYWSVRDDGSLYVDLSRITAVQAAGLADLRIDEYESRTGCIKRTRVKLGPKTRALELLGKHVGLWSDRAEGAQHNATLRERLERARERMLRGMSDEELTAKIKELQTQLESRHPKFHVQFLNAGIHSES